MMFLTNNNGFSFNVRPKQREKTLRFSGNQAVSTIEEQLCSVHRRALNALIKSLIEIGYLTNTKIPTINTIFQLSKYFAINKKSTIMI